MPSPSLSTSTTSTCHSLRSDSTPAGSWRTRDVPSRTSTATVCVPGASDDGGSVSWEPVPWATPSTDQVAETVRKMADEAIPVIGHVGLIPSRATWTGGFKAVGKTAQSAMDILEAVRKYEAAGAFGAEIEVVPVDGGVHYRVVETWPLQ